MAFSVQGKTALVTGGGSGICLELTKLLLHKQCSVVIADLQLSPEASELVQNEARVVFAQTDVTNWEQLEAAFDLAVKEFGGLDIVVPGAGIFEPQWSSFWHPLHAKTSQKDTFATLEINITHPIKATQLAIAKFQALSVANNTPQKGAVVLISSIAAQMTFFPYPLYACSKAAISSFVRSMGPLQELTGVRVMGIAPGIVKTPIWSEEKLTLVDEGQDEWVKATDVTEMIIRVIEEEKWEAGSIVEVGVHGARVIKAVGDEGPTRTGCIVHGDPTVVVGAALKGVSEEFRK